MARVNVPYYPFYRHFGGLNNARLFQSAAIYGANQLYSQYKKGTFSGISFNKPEMASGVLTNQYDARTTYRRHRGNPRRRRRWIRFTKKVQAVARDDLPTQVVFRTSSNVLATAAAANSQNHTSYSLYGGDGAGGSWDDLLTLFTDSLAVAPAGTIASALELFMKTAHIEITMRNIAGSNTAKVDIYTIKFKDDIDAASYNSVSSIFSNTITAYPTLGGTTTALNAAIRGVTPFMAPMFGTMCTIVSVKSYILAAGEVGTFKYVDKHHFSCQGEEVDNMAALRKYTTGFLVVAYAADAQVATATTINITAERKYFFVNQFADKITVSGT